MPTVDLNADLAEGCGADIPLIGRISSANIACAVHAGSIADMKTAVQAALRNGVRIGAHPGYPDRENFGRSDMRLSRDDLAACLNYQLGALDALCRAEGAVLSYVKPHGAMYNLAARDRETAAWIADTVYRFNPALKLMALSGSLLLQAGVERGLGVISEVFADRRYLPDGTLVPRSRADAQVQSDDEAVAQVLQMVGKGCVNTVGDGTVAVQTDSICLHGDGAHALDFADKIKAALSANGISVRAV